MIAQKERRVNELKRGMLSFLLHIPHTAQQRPTARIAATSNRVGTCAAKIRADL